MPPPMTGLIPAAASFSSTMAASVTRVPRIPPDSGPALIRFPFLCFDFSTVVRWVLFPRWLELEDVMSFCSSTLPVRSAFSSCDSIGWDSVSEFSL